jgi:hypothetical protein
MYCAKCGAKREVSALDKILFRDECEKCQAPLHSCINCKYYQVGLPNDCKVPGTERIYDRNAANFCEEFAPSEKKKESKAEDLRKRFEDLFK